MSFKLTIPRTSQRCALTARRRRACWAAPGRASSAAGRGRWSFPSAQHWWDSARCSD